LELTNVAIIDSSSFHQPRDLTLDLLSRQLATVNLTKLPNVDDLYSLLTSESAAIQVAVFGILHRLIPKAQEQVSFDVALSKINVRLPDSLLSLLMDPPTVSSFSAENDQLAAWTKLKTYLFSWKLVFDHFTNSVSAVRHNGVKLPANNYWLVVSSCARKLRFQYKRIWLFKHALRLCLWIS
jgi:E3 ubiquitin-protein ligase listerin